MVTEGRKNNITVSDQNFTTYSYGGQLQLNYTYAVPSVESQYPEIKGLSNSFNFLVSYDPKLPPQTLQLFFFFFSCCALRNPMYFYLSSCMLIPRRQTQRR